MGMHYFYIHNYNNKDLLFNYRQNLSLRGLSFFGGISYPKTQGYSKNLMWNNSQLVFAVDPRTGANTNS